MLCGSCCFAQTPLGNKWKITSPDQVCFSIYWRSVVRKLMTKEEKREQAVKNYDDVMLKVLASISLMNVLLSKSKCNKLRHIRFDATAIKNRRKATNHDKVSWASELTTDEDGEEIEGYLRDSHIMTLADAFETYFSNCGKKGEEEIKMLLRGAMQQGKTLVFLSIMLFLPIIRTLLFGKVTAIILSEVSDKGIVSQVAGELNALIKLYGCIRVVNTKTGENWGVDEYFSQFHKGSVQKYWDGLIQMRTKMKEHEELCNDYLAKGYHVTTFMDESHHGTHRHGCQARKEAPFIDRKDVDQITITATPSEQIAYDCSEGWLIVHLWRDTSYVGPSYWMGDVLPPMDPKAEIKMPKLMSMKDFCSKFGINASAIGCVSTIRNGEQQYLFYPEAYANQATFQEKVWNNKGNVKSAWLKFKDDMLKEIMRIIGLLDGSKKNRHIFFRLFRTNEDTEMFLKDLEPLLGSKHKIIRYFSETEIGSVKQLLREELEADQLAILFTTARARMGDSFPSSFRYFLDFTRIGSHITSLTQGTYGRACGHNKDTVVVLQQPLVDDMQSFLDNKCMCHDERTGGRAFKRRLSDRTNSEDHAGRGRPSINFNLLVDEHGDRPNIAKFFKAANEWLASDLNRGNDGNILIKVKKEAEINQVFCSRVLTNSFIGNLGPSLGERYSHFEFMQWGEKVLVNEGAENEMYLVMEPGNFGRRLLFSLGLQRGNKAERLNREDQQVLVKGRVRPQVMLRVPLHLPWAEEVNTLLHGGANRNIDRLAELEYKYNYKQNLEVFGVVLRMRACYVPKGEGNGIVLKDNSKHHDEARAESKVVKHAKNVITTLNGHAFDSRKTKDQLAAALDLLAKDIGDKTAIAECAKTGGYNPISLKELLQGHRMLERLK